jgi:hypothetical protein
MARLTRWAKNVLLKVQFLFKNEQTRKKTDVNINFFIAKYILNNLYILINSTKESFTTRYYVPTQNKN